MAILESAVPLVEERSSFGAESKRNLRYRSGRLTEVEDRLDMIKKLEKKYGDGTEGIMVYLHEAQEELQGLERSEEQKDEIERELEVREAQLLSMAEQLSRKRGSQQSKWPGSFSRN